MRRPWVSPGTERLEESPPGPPASRLAGRSFRNSVQPIRDRLRKWNGGNARRDVRVGRGRAHDEAWPIRIVVLEEDIAPEPRARRSVVGFRRREELAKARGVFGKDLHDFILRPGELRPQRMDVAPQKADEEPSCRRRPLLPTPRIRRLLLLSALSTSARKLLGGISQG